MSTFIHSLRGRVTLAFFLGALGLSVSVYLTADFFAEGMERSYSGNRLSENMSAVLAQAHAGEEIRLPYSATMRGYVFVRGAPTSDIAGQMDLTDLAPGLHELETGERELQVLVTDDGDHRYILTYDATKLERIEDNLHNLILTGLILITAIFTLYGYWMSAHIVRPIKSLADAVDDLEGGNSLLPTRFLEQGHGEVSTLGAALYSYSVRLRSFMARERSFTADVSHELRNPAMAASNALELLEARHDLDEKAKGQVQRVRRSVERMQDLIALFLSLSREPEVLAVEKPEFDVLAVVSGVVEDFQQTSWVDEHRLNVHVNGHPCGVGNASMAQVVLENVLVNAAQYAPASDIDIVVDDHGVSIADRGPGMNAAQASHMMQRHVRGTVSTVSRPTGMGLGLTIVKRLCEHQGWTVTIDSGPGPGTRVTFSFKARTSPA
ncbi:MAG: signal transduction histidine kinase [Gammaproteobacteria bacterium]